MVSGFNRVGREPGGRVSLRVEIDKRDSLSRLRQRDGEMTAVVVFADAALLIGDR